jgi:hypothetical protein
MTILRLPGRITANGQLEVELPEGLPEGDVQVLLEMDEETGWTEEEIKRILQIRPAQTIEERNALLDALYSDEWHDIEDPVAWVEHVRNKLWRGN